MEKLLFIYGIIIGILITCFSAKKNNPSIESSLITLPTAQVLKQRFIDNKLEELMNKTNIIQELADKNHYPFSISIIISQELFKNQKNITDITLEESLVATLMELVLQDLPQRKIESLKELGIIGEIKKVNRE